MSTQLIFFGSIITMILLNNFQKWKLCMYGEGGIPTFNKRILFKKSIILPHIIFLWITEIAFQLFIIILNKVKFFFPPSTSLFLSFVSILKIIIRIYVFCSAIIYAHFLFKKIGFYWTYCAMAQTVKRYKLHVTNKKIWPHNMLTKHFYCKHFF